MAEQIERQHSVENGKLIKVSVSSINKFRSCPRAWHWRYVSHVPDKEVSRGQQIGIEGHERLEHFYTTGQDVFGPLERMAQERGHLPPYDPTAVFPEAEFDFMEGDVKVNGFIDVVWLRAIDIACVDWKFKSDIDKYAASADDLVDPTKDEGVQMLGYVKAVSTLPQRKGDTALVRHVNMQYKGRRDVFMAEKTIEVAEAVRRWDGMIAEVLPRMKAAAAVKESLNVIGNENACDKYGGCPYLSRCFDPMARFNLAALKLEEQANATQPAAPRENAMGILDKLVAGVKGEAPKTLAETAPQPNAQTPPPEAAPAPTAEQRKALLLAELAQIEAKQKADVAQPAPVKALPSVLPPDAPTSDPALAAKADEPAPAMPKTRGRKPKGEAPFVPAAPADLKPEGLNKEIAHIVRVPAEAVHLYFVGSPVGVQTKSFMDYVYGLEKAILAAAKFESLGDIRLLSGNDFGFGKWRGILAQNAKQSLPPPGHYIVGTDERALTVAEALAGVLPAGSVVR